MRKESWNGYFHALHSQRPKQCSNELHTLLKNIKAPREMRIIYLFKYTYKIYYRFQEFIKLFHDGEPL